MADDLRSPPPESSVSDLQESPASHPEPLSGESQDKDQSSQECGDSANADASADASADADIDAGDEEENLENTLADADELMENGSKALKSGNYAEAVDCLSRALEIRVTNYGELAPECATAYYKYGFALLYKAQEEADPLVSVPKKETGPENSASNGTKNNAENSGSSSVAASKSAKGSATGDIDKDDAKDDIEENDNEQSKGDDEDLAEADGEDSDLDLAWKMLDIARAIVERQPCDTLEKVDIFSALAEVSLEREDIETSLSDYQKALSILKPLVEPDSRRIAELNFRICLALELGSRVEDAVPYCQRAISVCKSRIQRLKAEVESSKGLGAASTGANTINDSHDNRHVPDGTQDSSISEKLEEIETLSGLSSELEKKLEDLQQLILNPNSALSEFLKMVGSKLVSGEIGTPSTGGKASFSERMSSSQANASSACFDSPPATSANGNVMHLGVVGRGVKRATANPAGAEPSPKKPVLDSSGKESSTSGVQIEEGPKS